MNTKPAYIAIVGGIAVGKTSIINALKDSFENSVLIEEDVDKNIFLKDFYSDMKKWAFHSRISTLSMISNNYLQVPVDPSPKIVLLDRCIDELITFAQLHYDRGNMSDKEFQVYKELYNSILHFAPQIDLFVYVSCKADTSIERIRQRNRQFEQNISLEYITTLNTYYSNWLGTIDSKRVYNVCTDDGINIDKIVRDIGQRLSL